MSASGELRYEDYLADSHRPGFDGLRGIGFLMVITAHVPVVPLFGYLQGWSAVWIFLTMSGYLAVMLMAREEKRHGRIALWPYVVKRICRIGPAYWATILIYWFVCFVLEPEPGDYQSFTSKLGYYFAFLPEYANKVDYSIFTHAWTVGVEVKFYLLPPLLFLALRNADARFAVAALFAVLLTLQGSFKAEAYCSLMCGVMLAFAMERPAGYAAIARLTRVPVAVPLAMVAVLFYVMLYTEAFTALAVVATYLIAYTIVQPDKVARVLTWWPLVWLGQRSYGAYLLHVLALRLGYMIFGSNTQVGGLLSAAFCLAVTVPAAELLYRMVERPAMDFGRRLLSKPKPVTAR
jgi:peptidoglycan/LPS O-acetylase OafA/YrhL